jgi:uncharacterized cysteine cluster protein YcgN (CxxCxxCC family)
MQPFWQTKQLHELDAVEGEALCDGCAKCCAHKLQVEETGQVHYTCVACRLRDVNTCRCTDYANRREIVSECAVLSTDHPEFFAWMPGTCSCRLMHEGKPLPEWHPLITGNPQSAHRHGASARKNLIPECLADEKPLEKYIID